MPAIVWKGYLSFGLVSFPISLSAAARPETLHFHMLHKKDSSRVKEVWYCAGEDKPINRGDIVKGYEYKKGKYVIVGDEDLKKVAPPTASAMQILQFVKAGDVDPVFFEKSYYITPGKAGAKPYSLLWKAMTDTTYYGVGKVAMHSREHIVIIRPTRDGLILHTMYFADELHAANKPEKPAARQFNSKEIALAKQLIDALASPFQPEKYKDEYRENVEKLIEQKRKGHEVAAVRVPEQKTVIDIMDALKRSLKETSAPATKKASKRGRKAA